LNSSTEEFTYEFEDEIDVGSIVQVKLINKDVYAVVLKKVDKPEFACKEIFEVTHKYFSKKQIELAKFISDYYSSSSGISLSLFTPFKKDTKEKEKFSQDNKINLTCKQKNAYEFALQNKNSLLFGDTGSGKTEIYISLIYNILNQNKNVIYLLPEISLTPQLENRLKSHFGELVGIWHSKITKKKKAELLDKLHDGKIRIILGARSALFLPIDDIGLIIVDEEHDDSYKASNNPRYNARDIALFYGQKLDAKVVLGSATPNVTTIHKIPHFRLKGSYFEAQKEIIYENETNEITKSVLERIDLSLLKNEQIIVFLPTRAHFKYITCKECGTNITCPFCSVSMSLHKHHNLLKCHYCNYTSKVVKTCPKCGSETMEATRLGTAEVVDILRENYTKKRVEKFDRGEITITFKFAH
jgi:primosomal protein N' (replication factor Y)